MCVLENHGPTLERGKLLIKNGRVVKPRDYPEIDRYDQNSSGELIYGTSKQQAYCMDAEKNKTREVLAPQLK